MLLFGIALSSCGESSQSNLTIANLAVSSASFFEEKQGSTKLNQDRCPGLGVEQDEFDLQALKPPGFDISVGSLIEVLCSAYSRATKVNILNQALHSDAHRFSGVSVDFVRFTGEPYTFLYGEYLLQHRGAEDFQSYPVAIVIQGPYSPSMLSNNQYMDTKGRFDLALSFATGSPYNDPDFASLLFLKQATNDLALNKVTSTVESREAKTRTLAGEWSGQIASINMLCVPTLGDSVPTFCRMEFSGTENWRPGMVSTAGQGGKMVGLYQAWLDSSRELYLGGDSYRDYTEQFDIKRVSYLSGEVSKHGEPYLKTIVPDQYTTEDMDERFFKLYSKYLREREKQFLAGLQ
jgi:hypothetical protein